MIKGIYRKVMPKRVREALWVLRKNPPPHTNNTSNVNIYNDAMVDVVSGVALDRYKNYFGIYTSSDSDKLKSSVCRKQDLLDYDIWRKQLGLRVLNRKTWEFVYITQALYERNMLAVGKKGLGFAVGKEPLPSLFAKYGCEILATDIAINTDAGKHWAEGNQNAYKLGDLFVDGLCERDVFFKNVSYKDVNMNNIPDDLTGFDFCWSACAFEHLGSIQKGKDFIYNMMRCLKPGGVAVHTTEFNLSSYYGSLDNSDSVFFGRSDFKEMCDILTSQGHRVEEFDFRLGDYDEENYIQNVHLQPHNPHYKISLCGFVATSIGIIIQKAV